MGGPGQLTWAYSALGVPDDWEAAASAEITDGASLAEIVKLRPDLDIVAPLAAWTTTTGWTHLDGRGRGRRFLATGDHGRDRGCWSTSVTVWAAPTPTCSTGSTSCCSSCCPEAPRATNSIMHGGEAGK